VEDVNGEQGDESQDDFGIEQCRVALDVQPLNYWLWHRFFRLHMEEKGLRGALRASPSELQWKSHLYPGFSMVKCSLLAADGNYDAAVALSVRTMKLESSLLQTALEDVTTPSYGPTSYDLERKASLE
jgi:hypothetical protein